MKFGLLTTHALLLSCFCRFPALLLPRSYPALSQRLPSSYLAPALFLPRSAILCLTLLLPCSCSALAGLLPYSCFCSAHAFLWRASTMLLNSSWSCQPQFGSFHHHQHLTTFCRHGESRHLWQSNPFCRERKFFFIFDMPYRAIMTEVSFAQNFPSDASVAEAFFASRSI